MKCIVVYRITILVGVLLLTSELAAQKPTIDLITSHHLHRHPESMIDTAYATNPLVREPLPVQAPLAETKNVAAESDKKRRRQIGPSLDSLFQKKDSTNSVRQKAPVKISVLNRKFSPIKILIYITALK